MTLRQPIAAGLVLALALSACSSGESDRGGGLAVTPSRVTLDAGGRQAFGASIGGSAVTGVTWAVREGDRGGVVTGGGLYTAPASPGAFTVVATEPSSGLTGQATVTVRSESGTATHGLSIPTAHPRLWFDAERLARARAWFAANPFSPPAGEDSGGGYGDVALHGLLSDNASGSCTRAIQWGLSRLGDLRDTGGVACDPCRWTGEQLILVYDWCHAFMTPAQRDTYVSAVNAGLGAWAAEEWGGPAMYQNNYSWGYLRNELEWSIASYHENTAWAESMLDFVFTTRLGQNFNPSTLEGGYSRGGVASEGSEYGPAVAAYPIIPFVTAALHGRNLYEETDFWRESVYAVIHATTPAPTVVPGVSGSGYTVFPFSNDEGWNERFQAQTHYFPDFMTTVASYWPTSPIGRHARQWANMVGATPWRHVRSVDVPTAPLDFSALPLDFFASGPGFLYGRNAWGPSSTQFFIQGRDTDDRRLGHQHGDYGSFQIWRNGRYVSRETVTYEQSVAGYAGSGSADGGGPIGHNSLLVNGASPGPRYTQNRAIVERLESRPGYAYLATDLVPPATALTSWRREFVFVRPLETMVVLDRLETPSAGATKTFLNHCETAPVVSGNDAATCTVGSNALVMTTLVPAQRTYRVVDEGSAVYHQHRVEVDTTPGTAQSYILTVLQAKGATAPSLTPSVQESASEYTVRLDASHAVTFQKGMTSAGGSVTIAGATTPLRASVQRMTVSEAGPAWSP